MEQLITPGNITFAIGIVGIIFTIYNYFRKPQEDMEKKQLLVDKEIDSKATILAQKEMENKAALLDQQVKLERELNEKKFADMGCRLDTAMTVAQNHIHTVDTKVDGLIKTINQMSNEVTRIGTIIEERIPKK